MMCKIVVFYVENGLKKCQILKERYDMTKKLILIAMVAVLMLAIVGCGKNEEKENNESDSSKKEYVENDNVTQVPTVAPTIEATVVPTVKPETTVEPTKKPTKEPVATVEPSVEPTKEPTKEPVATVKPTKAPTLEPVATVKSTKAPTKAPVATVKPTKAPTKEPVATVKPTKAPTKAPVATIKPTKTPEPTKEPAKTYWYSWVIGGIAEKIEQSELPPDKYPLPDGYAKWTGPEIWDFYGEVWIGELKDNELAYNADGTPNLKKTIVYCADDEFAKYVLESKEFKAYFKEKGITNVTEFGAWGILDSRSPNAFEYSYINGDDPNGDFIYIYLDKNYKVVEENPYE